MARQWRLSGECRADDQHIEVTAPVARAGMAGVAVAVVLHFQPAGREGSLQGGADPLDPGHGNTLRNGRTSTRW